MPKTADFIEIPLPDEVKNMSAKEIAKKLGDTSKVRGVCELTNKAVLSVIDGKDGKNITCTSKASILPICRQGIKIPSDEKPEPSEQIGSRIFYCPFKNIKAT